MSAPATDRYSWWRNALAGKPGLVHDGEAQCGFYRRKRKSGGFEPAAVFEHEGKIVCVVAGRERDPVQEWSWLYAHPIAEATYRAVVERGEDWPDMDPTVAAALSPPSPGHNNPPTDPVELLKEQIDSARAGAADYAKIEDDETAKRAQSLRSRLLELSRQADKTREAEKKPFLEGGKAVDALWQPIIKAAKEAADQVAKAMGAWETAKARKAAEEQRKADQARREAEEKARKAAEAGKPAPEPAPVFDAPASEPAQAPATTIKGGYGRAASVRVVKIATVIDQDAAYGFLRTHPEVVDLISKLAQRAVDTGHDVPGVTIEEARKVA